MLRASLSAALVLVADCMALADEVFDAVRKLEPGMPLPEVRHILLEAGWAPDPDLPAAGKDGCLDQPEICASYPETSACWIEDERWFCALSYVDADPNGSVLTVRVRIDPNAGPVYVGYDEMAKGGSG